MEVILDPRVVADDAAHNPLLHVINYYTGRRRRLCRAQKQAVFMHHPPRLPTTAAPHPENQSLPHPHQSHCVTTRAHYLPLRPLGLPVPTRTPSNSSITLLVLAEQVCIFLPTPAASWNIPRIQVANTSGGLWNDRSRQGKGEYLALQILKHQLFFRRLKPKPRRQSPHAVSSTLSTSYLSYLCPYLSIYIYIYIFACSFGESLIT